MRPQESQFTQAEADHINQRGYRAFIRDNEDGSQQLITVYRDSTLLQVASRQDRWSTWGAPIYFSEIAH